MALPSTTRDGLVSRIVKRLPTSQPVSISPSNVQFIVTEYGIADLRNKTDASSANDANEIAGKIAAIAHPKFRESLALA